MKHSNNTKKQVLILIFIYKVMITLQFKSCATSTVCTSVLRNFIVNLASFVNMYWVLDSDFIIIMFFILRQNYRLLVSTWTFYSICTFTIYCTILSKILALHSQLYVWHQLYSQRTALFWLSNPSLKRSTLTNTLRRRSYLSSARHQQETKLSIEMVSIIDSYIMFVHDWESSVLYIFKHG